MLRIAIGFPDMLKWLLGKGTNLNVASRRPSSSNKVAPICDAIFESTTTSLEPLLEYCAVIEPSALYSATGLEGRADRRPHMKILLDCHADINYQNRRLDTPLYYAVRSRREGIIEFLLEQDADMTIRGVLGQTVLDRSKQDGATDIISILGN